MGSFIYGILNNTAKVGLLLRVFPLTSQQFDFLTLHHPHNGWTTDAQRDILSKVERIRVLISLNILKKNRLEDANQRAAL